MMNDLDFSRISRFSDKTSDVIGDIQVNGFMEEQKNSNKREQKDENFEDYE